MWSWPGQSRRAEDAPLRPEALPAGTRLGELVIDKPLARGSSATLYLARPAHGAGALAAKVLCPEGSDPDAQRARFLHDGERASQLVHPNIVRVHGGGLARGIAFLVMDLLPGHDLTRWATPAQRLPEAAVLDIAAQLALALDHAHRQGIVHRDVKPANAIYDPSTRRVVLTDFGLARMPDSQASRSGQMIGSPAYMAPELLAGASADARSDLYALGVLCYELLAGQPPFAAERLGDLLRAVATQSPPSLAQVRPALAEPEALDALLAPLLAKSPEARGADARAWAELAWLQRQWLTATPVSARS